MMKYQARQTYDPYYGCKVLKAGDIVYIEASVSHLHDYDSVRLVDSNKRCIGIITRKEFYSYFTHLTNETKGA
jgi:hypothetical protein